MVLAWLISLPWWTDLKTWQVAIHTVASVFTLLLVVLLGNTAAARARPRKGNSMSWPRCGHRPRSTTHPELRTAADHCGKLLGSKCATEMWWYGDSSAATGEF
ncbi:MULTISPECIES: hypothetical protein [Rhodococcus]|uniref:hypothetical protein n=1 Tax=Rhodococcus TaxID=1827 RepID=UPI001ED8C496|nr:MULTISPECIES: hypothetical protein [Rhodococcus]